MSLSSVVTSHEMSHEIKVQRPRGLRARGDQDMRDDQFMGGLRAGEGSRNEWDKNLKLEKVVTDGCTGINYRYSSC